MIGRYQTDSFVYFKDKDVQIVRNKFLEKRKTSELSEINFKIFQKNCVVKYFGLSSRILILQ